MIIVIAENGAGITQRSSIRDTDSEFVRLSKQGGHEGKLDILQLYGNCSTGT